jgi:hypothetical protein
MESAKGFEQSNRRLFLDSQFSTLDSQRLEVEATDSEGK